MRMIVVSLLMVSSGMLVRGAEDADARPEGRPELRERLKALPPEERAKMRERAGLPSREEMEKRREELKNLSPEERQKRVEELRKSIQAKRQELKTLTPEAREAKRKEVRGRLDKRLEELQKKKTAGSITPEEERRLHHLETLSKRFAKPALETAKEPESK